MKLFYLISKNVRSEDLSDPEDWVMVPREEDKCKDADKTVTDTSGPAEIKLSPVQLRRHRSEYNSQTELSQIGSNSDFTSSSTHNRYSSPLFQGVLPGNPIEAVRISTQSIPDDDSYENLIQTANLVSRSGSKTPEIKAPVESTNKTNELSEEALDENLSDNFSDPEKVLMANVVPGEMKLLETQLHVVNNFWLL